MIRRSAIGSLCLLAAAAFFGSGGCSAPEEAPLPEPAPGQPVPSQPDEVPLPDPGLPEPTPDPDIEAHDRN